MTPVTNRRTLLLGSLAAGALSSGPALGKSASPLAKTTAGRVQGTSANGIHVFKGIPYGADTRGHRFEAPLPPKPWSGVKQTLAYGAHGPRRLWVVIVTDGGTAQ